MKIILSLLVGLLCLGGGGSSNDAEAEFPPANKPEIRVLRLDDGKNVHHEGNVDFSGVWIGRGKEICFDIQNLGKHLYSIENIAVKLDAAFSKHSWSGGLTRRMEGPENQHNRFCVRFVPGRRGEHAGVVVITSNDPVRNPYVFHVTGRGWKVGYFVYVGDPSRPVDCGRKRCVMGMASHFGRVRVGSKSSRTFIIINRWGDPWIQPTVTISGQNANDFTLSGLAIDRVTRLRDGHAPRLRGDERFQQVILFSPRAPGIRRAMVRITGITHEDNSEPCEFGIQGEAFR